MAPKKFFNFNDNRPWAQHLQIVMQLGLTMAGSIVFCLFVGRLLDRWLATGGIFTAVFIILGIVGGGVVVYRQILEVTESEKNKDSAPDNEDLK